MEFYYRYLPHVFQIGQPIFLTWRLHSSLPPNRSFAPKALTSGRAFVAMDRLLDEAQTGSLHLRQESVADLVVEAIRYHATELKHYSLHAYVVMPNHVHLLVTLAVALPQLTKSLKGITAKRANQMLGLTGSSFWQEESYDHLVRNAREFERIRSYIEQNPVRAGLVSEASQYKWSSAGEPTRASAADQAVRPTPDL